MKKTLIYQRRPSVCFLIFALFSYTYLFLIIALFSNRSGDLIGAEMASGKVYVFALAIVFGVCLLGEAEAGVVQKVKDTFGSIKNYFRHGHSKHEHCDQSKEEIDNNSIDGNVVTTVPTPRSSTTDYPKLDVRSGVGEERTTVKNMLNRRLITPGSNDGCPEGQKMGIGNRCRTSI